MMVRGLLKVFFSNNDVSGADYFMCVTFNLADENCQVI